MRMQGSLCRVQGDTLKTDRQTGGVDGEVDERSCEPLPVCILGEVQSVQQGLDVVFYEPTWHPPDPRIHSQDLPASQSSRQTTELGAVSQILPGLASIAQH